MKKKIFLLLLGFMLLGIGCIKVNAEDVKIAKELKLSFAKDKDGKYIYRIYKNQNGDTRRSIKPILVMTIDGKAVFCIEMLELLMIEGDFNNAFNDFNSNNQEKSINNLLSQDINKFIPETSEPYRYNNKQYTAAQLIEYIELIGYYGSYLYNNPKDGSYNLDYYLATQRLIWQILADTGVYPPTGELNKSGYNEEDYVDGQIYLSTTTKYGQLEFNPSNATYSTEEQAELNKLTKDNIKNSSYDLSVQEKEILKYVDNYYTNKPKLFDTKEIKDYILDDDNKKYFELDNKDNLIGDFTFEENSECKLNDDNSKIICIDSNDNNKIELKINKESNNNNYLIINDGNINQTTGNLRNQLLMFAENTPKISFEHSIELVTPEKTPIENIVVEEPPVESPPTSDTNIILIITICLCTLISAIIIYIKKVNLIKNNTI